MVGYQNANAQEQRIATHYHPMYIGGSMSCPNTPKYSPDNIQIAALSYADKERWPCGTNLIVSAPVGSISVIVMDTCGGCTNQIDLSEAGKIAVCGSLANNCEVTVYEVS